MSRRNIFQRLFNGDVLPTAEISALKALTLHSGVTSYMTLKQSIGPINKAVFTLTDFPLTVANTSAISFGTDQLATFPQGRIGILGGTCNLTFDWSGQDIVATGSGDFAFGTTGTADSTLGSTDVDLMASTALTDPFVAGVGAAKGVFVTGPTEFDGTATAKEIHINAIVDDADVSDGASDIITIDGTITLLWLYMGDY
jgi:hypothetical protein